MNFPVRPFYLILFIFLEIYTIYSEEDSRGKPGKSDRMGLFRLFTFHP